MKKDLKDKIISAFASSTPDLSEKIKEKSKNQPIEPLKSENVKVESKKKKSFYIKRAVFAFSFAVIFALGIALGNVISFSKSEKVKATSEFYIDVNPSVKLTISGYKTVVSCEALNDDATKIIEGLELENVEINTAVYAIIGKMLGEGYLTGDSNSVLFSVCGEENGQSDFINEITTKINSFLTDCSIIAQRISVDDEMRVKAEENKISVGKMAFIDKIIERDEAFKGRQDEFAEKSIKELSLMYNRGDAPNDNDVVKGDGVFEEENEIINKVVQQARTDYSLQGDLRGVEVSIVGFGEDKTYRVSFDINGRRYFYEYEYKSGTITDNTQNIQPPFSPEPPFKGEGGRESREPF